MIGQILIYLFLNPFLYMTIISFSSEYFNEYGITNHTIGWVCLVGYIITLGIGLANLPVGDKNEAT